MTPERKRELQETAQKCAEKVARETGSTFSIVLLSDGDTSIFGAWVPNLDVFRALLANALASLDEGSATVVDKRRK